MVVHSINRWEIKSSTGKHFDVLDGLRGVAILMVVAFHTFYTNPESGVAVRAVAGLLGTGWMGVPIFFVLSGFLISYPFFREREKNARFWYQSGYAARRIGKIMPPFYLSIMIFTLYYCCRFSDAAYLYTGLEWALGLPNFVLAPLRFNSSYWSLIVEAHFYVILPILFLLTRGLRARHTVTILFFMLLVVPLVTRQLTWPGEAVSKDTLGFLMSRFPCQLDFFAWGILFSGIYVSLSAVRDEVRLLSLLGYAGLALLIASIALYARWARLFNIDLQPARWSTEVFHLLPGASAFLMLFFVFDPYCIGSRILGHSSLRFIGIVSYEWFLFHLPVVYLFRDVFGRSHGSVVVYLLKTILPLALTFGFSVIVYRFFSLPLMKRIRGQSPTGKPPFQVDQAQCGERRKTDTDSQTGERPNN
ncbi:MAG TPA: acyltransferase [Candidatus Acidoferrum sp.]|nr:acyltransferase [Candidatus Acidoferrum sp.]